MLEAVRASDLADALRRIRLGGVGAGYVDHTFALQVLAIRIRVADPDGPAALFIETLAGRALVVVVRYIKVAPVAGDGGRSGYGPDDVPEGTDAVLVLGPAVTAGKKERKSRPRADAILELHLEAFRSCRSPHANGRPPAAQP